MFTTDLSEHRSDATPSLEPKATVTRNLLRVAVTHTSFSFDIRLPRGNEIIRRAEPSNDATDDERIFTEQLEAVGNSSHHDTSAPEGETTLPATAAGLVTASTCLLVAYVVHFSAETRLDAAFRFAFVISYAIPIFGVDLTIWSFVRGVSSAGFEVLDRICGLLLSVSHFRCIITLFFYPFEVSIFQMIQ